MELVRWILSVGLVKGLVFGIRPYEFRSKEEDVYEVDHVLYLGFIQIILTTIYAETEV